MDDMIIPLFVDIDNFCLNLEEYLKSIALGQTENFRLLPSPKISLSEVMTIVVLFQLSHFRDFKSYYLICIKGHYSSYLKWLPSYSRFVELMQYTLLPLLFMQTRKGWANALASALLTRWP
ncbi:MAG: hypothetical protein FWG30_12160 [Eubacteriaceae bacterium]|nr:hypothetical protein [Eubacteriaceae bacterium]